MELRTTKGLPRKQPVGQIKWPSRILRVQSFLEKYSAAGGSQVSIVADSSHWRSVPQAARTKVVVASKSSEAGRSFNEVDHVGCGVCGQRMMSEARPRRDVARHFAREF